MPTTAMRTLRRAASAPPGTPTPNCPFPKALAVSPFMGLTTPFRAYLLRTGDRRMGLSSALALGQSNNLTGAQGVHGL
eukprot:12889909-Alexandrium_andersonii.AAC.1